MIQKFEFSELDLKGAYLIKPFYATDERGGFVKDYNIDTFLQNGIKHELKEVFYTISKKGVIRATHFQLVKQQPKLVRCISGHVYDVIVDLRPDSETFGQWRGFDLTGENQNTLYIPEFFGHGYLVLEDSVVSYKCGEVFYGEGDSGIKYDDKEIGVIWPFEKIGGIEKLIISEKDKNLMSFEEYKKLAGELGIADRVCFAGLQKNPFAWMKKAQLCVGTSAMEGFPNALVECMACGVGAVFANCMSGPAEILSDRFAEVVGKQEVLEEAYGILIPVMDDKKNLDPAVFTEEEKKLAELLTALLTDSVHLKKLVQAAKVRAAHFSDEAYAQTILRIADGK